MALKWLYVGFGWLWGGSLPEMAMDGNSAGAAVEGRHSNVPT
jgi:hypothetical protein